MQCLCLVLVVSFLTLFMPHPAQALLGEDHLMVTSYYNAPSRWPAEMKARIDQFAKVQRDTQPQIMQLFKNDEGKITKQVWVAQGDLWSLEQSNQIRQAIMQNQRSKTSYLSKNQQIYIYPDGSHVHVQFNPRNYRVHTIWAISKDHADNRDKKMPESLWKKTRIFYPQS